MKNPEKLIGKKVRGFKYDGMLYASKLDNYIGKIGTIKKWDKENLIIDFGDDFFFYPADQIEAHLVEDEIPTLSDGFMMLVSDGRGVWFEREVVFKYKDRYITILNELFQFWKYAKPIEPTKEEQLTAILGSSEKVSEIMELFKN